jgi:hypothetical protein
MVTITPRTAERLVKKWKRMDCPFSSFFTILFSEWGRRGEAPALGEPRGFDSEAVKTHKGLLLTRVTEPFTLQKL